MRTVLLCVYVIVGTVVVLWLTVECQNYSPLPDYYSGILWSRLMGSGVLRTTSSDPSLRAYAHCSAEHAGAVTVLLINLEPSVTREVTLQGLGVSRGPTITDSMEWHLTGPHGPASSQIALNGRLLEAKIERNGTVYTLPPLVGRPTPRKVGEPLSYQLAAASIAFIHLHSGLAACVA